MRKRNRMFIGLSLAPAALCFVAIFAFPLIRTFLMSLFQMPSLSSGAGEWKFVGLQNYRGLFSSGVFKASLWNVTKIWLIGGVLTIAIALFFAVILASGVKGKRFWRSAIYLPNTVSAVALSTMWLQYVFQNKFGLLKELFTVLGMESLAKVNWTAPDHLFWAMLISYVFGSVGYFMLIFLSGIEQIPTELYESARLDGANSWVQFWRLTFPLIRSVFRTCVTLWTVTSVNFFTWAKMFSSRPNVNTITPVYYMHNQVFGTANAGSVLDIGAGAAVGVLVAILVLIAHTIMNRLLKEEGWEY